MRKPKELFINKGKHVLLFFTGGLDSTYLLWKNLELGNTVTPVYIEIENNEDKTTIEKQQTKFIWSLLKEKHKERLKSIEEGSKITIAGNGGTVKLAQVPFWVTFALYQQRPEIHDEIHIGYVQEDAATGSYLKDIEKMYYSFLPITNGLAEMKFPLRQYSKFNMIHELPEEIFDAIITCEIPIIKPYKISKAFDYAYGKENYRFWKPCGRCEMCKKIKANDYYYTRKEYKTELDEIENKPSMKGGIMAADEVAFSDAEIEIKKYIK